MLLTTGSASLFIESRARTPDKAWVHALPLSTRLSMSPRRVTGFYRGLMLGSIFCLSSPGLSCLLDESRLALPDKAWVYVLTLSTRLSVSPRRVAFLTSGQGMGPRFAYLHQIQRVSSSSRGLALQDKAWVQVLPLTTRISVSPRGSSGSHSATSHGSMFCLSPPGSACFLT